jgi:L-asparaginase
MRSPRLHAGPIGRVADGAVRFTAAPPDPSRPLRPAALDASVAHVPMLVGDQGTMLDLARREHDGVVIEAFGSGNMPPGAVPAVRRWIEGGKPVVLASRCWWGQVTPLYAFDGGGARTTAMGAIPAGPRTPSQARMELAIALSAGVPYGSP